MKDIRWKAGLALIVIWVGVAMDWNWIWGVLFISWTIPALVTRRTHLFEEVERAHNPVLYWLIVSTWILLSIYMIASDILGAF